MTTVRLPSQLYLRELPVLGAPLPMAIPTSAAGNLPAPGSLDSYMTMFVGRGRRGRLAPGQFERIAKAFADPRRFALLEAIGTSDACPNQQLCREFPVSKATISHHLKELVQAGLVDAERDGQSMNLRVRPDVIEAYTAELLRRVGGKADEED